MWSTTPNEPIREAKSESEDLAGNQDAQETAAMLEIVATGQIEIEAGRTKPLNEVISRLKAKGAIAAGRI